MIEIFTSETDYISSPSFSLHNFSTCYIIW